MLAIISVDIKACSNEENGMTASALLKDLTNGAICEQIFREQEDLMANYDSSLISRFHPVLLELCAANIKNQFAARADVIWAIYFPPHVIKYMCAYS